MANCVLLEGFFCCHGSSSTKYLVQITWWWEVCFPTCTASGVFLFPSPFMGLCASHGSAYSTPCHFWGSVTLAF